MRKLIVGGSQVAVLAGFNELGHLCVNYLSLALPGNLIGMLMLLTLLSSGIVRLSWVELGANVLLKHLAFFFVPIAVGLMAFSSSLQTDGIAWLITLVVAAGAGILSAGFVTQALMNRSRVTAERRIAC